MPEDALQSQGNQSKKRTRGRSPLVSAPRQPSTLDAWKEFSGRLLGALQGLEEDEWLVLNVKGTNRYVQFMAQGSYGMRAESVSDFYLAEDEHLDEDDYKALIKLGWHAPTNLPDQFGYDPDGSPNYFLDLAQPVPLDDVAILGVLTLSNVHGACFFGMPSSMAPNSKGFPDVRASRSLERARS